MLSGETGSTAARVDRELLVFVVVRRFSFECRKTNAKLIDLANHTVDIKYSEPVKIQSCYMQLK